MDYFSEDHILADINSDQLYDIEATIGSENLKFGYGSGDGNVVYVMNDQLRLNIEVGLRWASYAIEILGLDTDSERTP